MPEASRRAAQEAIVVAMTRQRVIGSGQRLPWHCPEELRLFRDLTLGGTVVMGRATFAAIGRPLPQRRNLVVSTTLPPQAGIEVYRSFADAVAAAQGTPEPIYYIGGAAIYRLALPRVGRLHVSWMKLDPPGDRHFPAIDPACWEAVREEEHEDFVHVLYRRRGGADG